MRKTYINKVVGLICTISILLSMSITAFAETTNLDKLEPLEVYSENDISILYEETTETISSEIKENQDTIPSITIEPINMMSRGTWRLSSSIFAGQQTLSASEPTDFFIFNTTMDTAPAMKIISDNPNLVMRIYELNTSTGVLTEMEDFIYDISNDDTSRVYPFLAAGDYVLLIYSLDSNIPYSEYTFMWNASNPSNATDLIDEDYYLSEVTLGYATQDEVYCNGVPWLSELEWAESYTFYTGTGHTSRNQSISNVNVTSVKKGTYHTSEYSTDNALFIGVGVGSSWTFMRSYYNNYYGDTIHEMDFYDATGQRTPRSFDYADMDNGPHYIVIDLDTNNVVDFYSIYNYLWLTEQTTGTATITQSIF